MRTKKPCKECGSLDRHKNGACRPCANKKQAVRNENDRGPSQYALELQKKRSREEREKAKEQNLKVFDSMSPCFRCNGTLRYVSNGGCIKCS